MNVNPGSSITVQGGGPSITVQGGPSITVQPEIGVYPKGDDPNILLKEQIQAGTPLPQGPLGPIIPSPRPASFPVTQTPRAPQIYQTVDPRISVTPISRKGDTRTKGSHRRGIRHYMFTLLLVEARPTCTCDHDSKTIPF